VYPITHIDQGLELLTGVPAGTVETPETLHYRVNQRLQRLAQDMTTFGEEPQNGVKPAEVSSANS
jgi:hypothetical protein